MDENLSAGMHDDRTVFGVIISGMNFIPLFLLCIGCCMSVEIQKN